jgi:hypothetical protein
MPGRWLVGKEDKNMQNTNMNTKSNVDLAFGRGKTTLLATTNENALKILDYEFDHEVIHETLGGQMNFISSSGNTGEGSVPSLGDFFRIGYYHVEARSAWPVTVEIGKGVYMFAPWQPHKGIQTDYPMVFVRSVGSRQMDVVFDYIDNSLDTLKLLMNGELPDSGRKSTYDRLFHNEDKDVEIKLNFINRFNSSRAEGKTRNPWMFVTQILERQYKVMPVPAPEGNTLLTRLGLFHSENGAYYETVRLNSDMYAIGAPIQSIFPDARTYLHGWAVDKLDDVDTWMGTRESRNGDYVMILMWNANEAFVLDRVARGIFVMEREHLIEQAKKKLADKSASTVTQEEEQA